MNIDELFKAGESETTEFKKSTKRTATNDLNFLFKKIYLKRLEQREKEHSIL